MGRFVELAADYCARAELVLVLSVASSLAVWILQRMVAQLAPFSWSTRPGCGGGEDHDRFWSPSKFVWRRLSPNLHLNPSSCL